MLNSFFIPFENLQLLYNAPTSNTFVRALQLPGMLGQFDGIHATTIVPSVQSSHREWCSTKRKYRAEQPDE